MDGSPADFALHRRTQSAGSAGIHPPRRNQALSESADSTVLRGEFTTLVLSKLVNLCRQDEVTLRQSIYLVRPILDLSFSPRHRFATQTLL